MSNARPAEPGPDSRARKRILLSLAAAVLAVLVCLFWLGSRPRPANTTAPGEPRAVEDALELAREALYERPDLTSCRGAIEQINTHLSRNPDRKPRELTGAERQVLADPNLFGLDADELAEAGSGTFTALDAHHLEACFLFRDAARSLEVQGLPPAEQAARTFAWVVRQVRLQEGPRELLPPEFVLRRGYGTSADRTLVFLALLNQLGIDGCLVVCPGTSDEPGLRSWTAGALVGKDVYLFDTRMGLPLPGPEGQGVATLAAVRAKPDLLGQLTIDPRFPYDITPAQVKGAKLLLACDLSALAPRMKGLEGDLAANNRVVLSADPAALLGKFREATREQGVEVGVWKQGVRVTRSFLPPDEGGTDRSNRLQLLMAEQVPFPAMPPPMRELVQLSQGAMPGARLQVTFAELFIRFPLPPPPQQAATRPDEVGGGSLAGAEPEARAVQLSQRFLQWFVLPQAPPPRSAETPAPFLLAAGSPHDQVLRGRFDEAAPRLVEALDQVRYQQSLAQGNPKLPQKVKDWCDRARSAYVAVLRARPEEKKEAENRASLVWLGGMSPDESAEGERSVAQAGPSGRLPVWLVGLLVAAAGPMNDQAGYLLAQCKHEQAERLGAGVEGEQGQAAPESVKAREEAWKAAADLWETYLREQPSAPGAPSARALLARARLALGQPDAARSLLENLDGNLSNLEKTGRIYQARRLSKSEPRK